MNNLIRYMFLTTVILTSVLILFILFIDDIQTDQTRQTPRKNINSFSNKVTFDDIIDRRESFNFTGHDLIVLLHIQKTGGTTFEKHLVQDLLINNPCSCSVEKRRCSCFRGYKNGGSIIEKNSTWLISRFSTGWICGLHADWTQLTNCLASLKKLYFVTFLRNPLHRFLSEFRHVQRGATWKSSKKHCENYDTYLCYKDQTNWSNVSLKEFMNCPHNMAINRQTRMLADHNLPRCSDGSADNSAMLISAKRNLKNLAFFGICDEQRNSQLLFEKTFNLKFRDNFRQSEDSKAKAMEQELIGNMRSDVMKLNHLDVELYNYGLELFHRRLNLLGNISE